MWRPAISADGRFVAFESAATNLVPDDDNGIRDVFVRDLKRGQTTRVSVNSAGAELISGRGVEELGTIPAISRNGRYVAFSSRGKNLVEGDRNDTDDIFVRDRKLGETTRVSVSSTGEEANGSSLFYPSISANGRFVAFTSWASNLVAGDENGHAEDVFVRDRKRGVTTRIRENNRSGSFTAAFPRSRPTDASSPSSPPPRTWSKATETRPSTSSCATESGARRRSSASVPKEPRETPKARSP